LIYPYWHSTLCRTRATSIAVVWLYCCITHGALKSGPKSSICACSLCFGPHRRLLLYAGVVRMPSLHFTLVFNSAMHHYTRLPTTFWLFFGGLVHQSKSRCFI
jgi:hypothetical protein